MHGVLPPNLHSSQPLNFPNETNQQTLVQIPVMQVSHAAADVPRECGSSDTISRFRGRPLILCTCEIRPCCLLSLASRNELAAANCQGASLFVRSHR